MKPNKFAERLRQLTKANNQTHKELSDLLYVSRQSISLYFTGKTQPSIEGIIAIAEHFGVSTDYLLGVTDVPNYEPIQNYDKLTIRVNLQLNDDTIERLKNDSAFRDVVQYMARML